ncbi:STAS domain-containing protein [Planctomycetales bacterium ZRK34]|nr:STAS domain-containing protein [Planctomycetales bacterium ZRK34]
MKIHEQRHGAVMILRPEGPLVDQDVVPFRQQLNNVRRASLGRVVVDMSTIPFIDSKGLETLVEVTREMADSGQALRLCNVNETIREVLELTELSPMFEHYADANSAVRSFL